MRYGSGPELVKKQALHSKSLRSSDLRPPYTAVPELSPVLSSDGWDNWVKNGVPVLLKN